ncbi:DUF2442 domain-containing protein [Phyllobacterium myrsinacearum]|uniref:DUF2442 domain-containing protein n=1 Tax=Phyllobacterium myrsinacearum TaxID=28101 RepID=UPI000D9EB74D|nr:DUF2442 domain-containing protein [Phyllobacterium myrsinacearum]PWV94200.1 uncharacterized protein DUF2442 [Phyllobacterium myrsinacearum]RZV07361.1 uncharacterized protein DUF2442 [Phyllobacterium myrsinacearum]
MSGTDLENDDVITAGLPLPRIRDVVPLDRRKVAVTWRSGETKIVDLAPALASHRVYIPLRDDDGLFRTMRVSEYGEAIEWTDELDFSAVWIARLPPVTFDNQEFRTAMDELGMSLDGMAAALEVSRRLIADFRKDKPIPRHIALATRYLIEHHKRSA